MALSGRLYENPTQYSSVVLFCGTTSSICAIMITYPFDNLRVRWQAGEIGGILDAKQQDRVLWGTIKHVYDTEGIKGFYKGYLPRILKKGCSGGILWTIYEKISNEEKEKEM